jgi:hypothetical protein
MALQNGEQFFFTLKKKKTILIKKNIFLHVQLKITNIYLNFILLTKFIYYEKKST